MDSFVSTLVALFMFALFALILAIAVWYLIEKVTGAGKKSRRSAQERRKGNT